MDISSYFKKDVVDAVDYLSEQLFDKYSGLNFTIKYREVTGKAVWFLIHDKEVFLSQDFQNFIYLEINRNYLWPKKIYNIIFVYEPHE